MDICRTINASWKFNLWENLINHYHAIKAAFHIGCMKNNSVCLISFLSMLMDKNSLIMIIKINGGDHFRMLGKPTPHICHKDKKLDIWDLWKPTSLWKACKKIMSAHIFLSYVQITMGIFWGAPYIMMCIISVSYPVGLTSMMSNICDC